MRNRLDLEELLLAKSVTSELIRDCDVSVQDRIFEAFDKEIEQLRRLHLMCLESQTPTPSIDLSDLMSQVYGLK